MTRAQHLCSQGAPSTLRARPGASAHLCAPDPPVRRTLAAAIPAAISSSRTESHLRSAVAGHADRTPLPLERHPPIQSP